MHHIYHTEGIILGSKNFGEADKIFYIYTKELGMVYAVATGIRKLSSKLRFVLQDYMHVNVDLVRGRDIWRVTTASKSGKTFLFKEKTEQLKVVAQISLLCRRLLAGEEVNEKLFMDLSQGFSMVYYADSKDALVNAEIVVVLKLLSNLGYIRENKWTEGLLNFPFDNEILAEVEKSKPNILREINQALRETHM